MNTLKNPNYIKLLHSIRSCTDYKQLSTLTELVLAHVRENTEDGELILEFLTKENSLSPNLNTIIDNPKFNIRLQTKQL